MLSIVIPTRLRKEKLLNLIRSIQSYAHPIIHQVIVVCNEHEEDVEKSLKQISTSFEIKYAFTGSKGVNKARNLGIQIAKANSSYILFLDDDCVIMGSNFFSVLKDKIDQKILAIGGYYYPLQMSGLNTLYYLKKKTWLDYHQSANGALRALGGCLIVKTTLFEKYQFNDNIIFGGSETDFILRLVADNIYLNVEPKLFVGHIYDESFLKLLNKFFRQGRYHYATLHTSAYFHPEKSFDRIFNENLKELNLNFMNKWMVFLSKKIHAFVFRLSQLSLILFKPKFRDKSY